MHATLAGSDRPGASRDRSPDQTPGPVTMDAPSTTLTHRGHLPPSNVASGWLQNLLHDSADFPHSAIAVPISLPWTGGTGRFTALPLIVYVVEKAAVANAVGVRCGDITVSPRQAVSFVGARPR